jgi:putative DNA primase/helicase
MTGAGFTLLDKKGTEEILVKLQNRTYVEQYAQLSPTKIPNFDQDLSIINMENGLYNWKTEEFTGHSSEYLSRIQIATRYDPNADDPTIREINKDILGSRDYPKFMEFLAYCMYRGYDIQKMMLLFGPGGTGKSVLLSEIKNLIGAWNCTTVTFQDLGGKTLDRYATAKLYNKLVNIAGDLDTTYVSEVGRFKMLLSGDDPIAARFPYGKPFTFESIAKTIMSANDLPPINDKSDGFYRRMEIIQCLNRFKASDGKFARLQAISDPEELSGLFNEAISYLPSLLERKEFTNAMTIEQAKKLYKRASNTVEIFCNDCIDTNFDKELISKEDLYKTYKRYCVKYKLPHIDNDIAFGRALKKVMGWTGSTKNEDHCNYNGVRKHCWVGIRVTFIEEE